MARSAAEKMLDYRSRKRGQGLRLVQLSLRYVLELI